MSTSRLLCTKEVAEMLAVSRRTVERYVERGLLGATVRIGGIIRIPASSVEALKRGVDAAGHEEA